MLLALLDVRSAPPRYGAVLATPRCRLGKNTGSEHSLLVLLAVRGWGAAVAVQRLKPQETGDEAVGGTELASQHMQKRCSRGQAAGMAIVQVGMCFFGMPLVQVLPAATEAWEGALLHDWFIRIYSRTRCYVVTREPNWPRSASPGNGKEVSEHSRRLDHAASKPTALLEMETTLITVPGVQVPRGLYRLYLLAGSSRKLAPVLENRTCQVPWDSLLVDTTGCKCSYSRRLCPAVQIPQVCYI